MSKRDILRAFKATAGRHDNVAIVDEHGGRFVQCLACGALASVQTDGHGTPVIETMEDGDESCRR